MILSAEIKRADKNLELILIHESGHVFKSKITDINKVLRITKKINASYVDLDEARIDYAENYQSIGYASNDQILAV